MKRTFGLLVFALSILSAAACGRTLPQTSDGGGVDGSGFDGHIPDATRPDVPVTCRTDAECDDGRFCNGPESCVGGRCFDGMPPICDTGDRCAMAVCDPDLDTCVVFPGESDRDGDGFPSIECGGTDCDDFDPEVFPGHVELCFDMRDNDCNGAFDCADAACTGDPACGCVPRMEICTNMDDDDCDMLADCDDPDCAMSPTCACVPTPEDCGNGLDDDCDLAVDCSDMDCAGAPECCVASPERCGNMTDDDCDMRVDCDDPDCAMNPLCVAPCPDADLGSRVGPSVAMGTTTGRPNSLTATCGGMANSPDIAYSWRAPSSGRFVIDTIGSDYDTVLYVKNASCTGPELACNDDTSGLGLRSRVTIDVMAGQSVVIVVDGFGGGSSGSYVLNITAVMPEAGNCDDGIDNDRDGTTDCGDSDCAGDPVCMRPCPDTDLMSAVGVNVASGTTVGMRNDLTGTCAPPGGAPDLAFSWTAPRAGRYRFDTAGSTFNTVLYLLEGGTCAGRQLVCNDDAGATTRTSRITRDITAGTTVVIVVDGAGGSAGSFQLNITAFERGFCSDGIDNDLDGLTDCADPECSPLPICCVPTAEICNDMRDQDCDGLVDCADPNCRSSTFCCTPRPEDCANGADEDCDGLIDCVDPDCTMNPVC